MQNQAQKINNLIGQLGLKQNVIASKLKYHHTTISRKAKDGTPYPNDVLEKLSMELGITVAFLKDSSREYHKGDPIPEDAIRQVPPTQQEDISGNLTKLLEIQIQNIQHNQSMQQTQQVQVLTESLRSVTELVKDLAGQVKELKDQNGGSHDPD